MGKKQQTLIPFERKQSNTYNAEIAHEVNHVGNQIRAARKAKGLTVPELAEQLAKYGVKMTRHGVTKWETGGTVPNTYQLMALCYSLDIDDCLAYFSGKTRPAELNEIGLRKLAEYKEDLIATGRYNPDLPDAHEVPLRNIRIMRDAPVSAGTGTWLEEQSFDIVSLPAKEIPEKADFGIRISGDSMEPEYHDGQYVWIEQCEELIPGEVGIFIYDGESYIKVFGEQEPAEDIKEQYLDSEGVLHKQPVLISYNTNYEPKLVLPDLSFAIIGRVLQ